MRRMIGVFLVALVTGCDGGAVTIQDSDTPRHHKYDPDGDGIYERRYDCAENAAETWVVPDGSVWEIDECTVGDLCDKTDFPSTATEIHLTCTAPVDHYIVRWWFPTA